MYVFSLKPTCWSFCCVDVFSKFIMLFRVIIVFHISRPPGSPSLWSANCTLIFRVPFMFVFLWLWRWCIHWADILCWWRPAFSVAFVVLMFLLLLWLQWIALVRRHAEVVVDDEVVYPAFKKFCKVDDVTRNLFTRTLMKFSASYSVYYCLPTSEDHL